MDSSPLPWYYLAAGAAVAAGLLHVVTSSRDRKRYPPGPPPYPLVGNYPHMPVGWRGSHYLEMGKKYGSILYFTVPGRSFIVLNKYEDAVNLFEKRGNRYSDRPHLHMAHELVGRKITILFSQYGERLKQYRRMIHTVSQTRAAPQQWPMQTAETQNLLNRLLDTPDDFLRHLRLHSVSVTMKTVYGYTPKSHDDEYVKLSEKVALLTNMASQPGRWLVDSFRWLEHIPEWFPGGGFKKLARKWRTELEAFTDAPMQMTKKRLAEGTAEPCFVVGQLEDTESISSDLREEYIKYAAAGMYSGGTDSTVSFVSCFILCMTMFPEVQRKAQEELDAILGGDRLPVVEDTPYLPYIEAVIKEVHRIHPIVNLIPHATLVDDEYKGYAIPAGAAVLANTWAFSRDEEMYPDPDKFDPERFLGKRGEGVLDPRLYTFGLGRRRCAGVPLADSFTFLAVTSILTVFNISKALDENGQEITPGLKWDNASTSHPIPFKCKIRPRSEAAVALIRTRPSHPVV
ncbi:cytochrome P450 [Exidia glandulosa HHB12029]|uniref:Cytochrome P450 n=1 Tax=Exidia glandulosa HHB12029 TaxID=1314781 RepID=A0A165H437_EXIGL|nr:cytochrome P450 [Exidia glandulosa HHB12029]